MTLEFDARLTATYRLQFHKDFDFAAGARRAAYLRDLGVSHVYASPIMQAKAGSTHGYDVTDFAVVNGELGGERGFRELAAALRAHGLGLIVDIVPNHMAVGGDDNPYWLDLLEKGRDSAYADFFDVDFDAPGLDGKLLAPFLGSAYAETLEKGELVVKPRGDGYAVFYAEHCFPLRDVDRQTIRAEGVEAFMAPARLHALLQAQHYRLAHWRAANDLLNYRRFFEITTLAGVRIERPEAFDRVHRVPLQLYAEGLIDGVRVDHVDGLSDPAGYCERLRAAMRALTPQRPEGRRGEPYIVVEKILASDETPPTWPIEGTTGYDFMNEVSALQHDDAGAAPLRQFWAEISGRAAEFEPEERLARAELLDRNFAGQLESVVGLIHRECVKLSGDRDLTRGAVRRALIAVVCHLRVYRSYALGGAANPGAGEYLERAFTAAAREPSRDDAALEALRTLMQSKSDSHALSEAIRRFHQLTAPVAAKSVEDTAFYRHAPLLSRNDVGFDAARFAMSIDEFHERMKRRAQDWPHAMLTTATHDHKRGEDSRARLAVLSEIPARWIDRRRDWGRRNATLRAEGFDAADEDMLFQTIVGAWPPDLTPTDRDGLAAFAERLATWINKALREAKLRTSWLTPNEAYERCAERYVAAALDPGRSAPFLADVAKFVGEIAAAGMANALTQTALRCLAPGVPDLYRGSEFWDLTLVDPDNRRPVDFDARERALADGAEDVGTGAIKQALIRRLLHLRREESDLFAFGDYEPIAVEGGDNVVGFVRRFGDKAMAAVVALNLAARLAGGERLTPEAGGWGDARIAFDLTGYDCVCGGAESGANVALSAAFAELPVAVWIKR